MSEQVDLDAMLDEALDEIDDESDEEKETHKVASNAVFKEVSESPDLTRLELTQEEEDTSIVSESKGLSNTTASEEQSPADVFQSMLKDFIQAEDGSDPDEHLVQFMDQVESQLPAKTTEETPEKPDDDENNVDKTIAAILEEMAKANIGDKTEEEILKEMFDAGFPNGGEGFDPESFNPDAVIDGMMEQLLSKDLMYEPMKQVTDKFPQWLEDNQSELSPSEYEE